MASSSNPAPLLPGSMRARLDAWLRGVLGYILLTACVAAAASLLTWSVADPSFTRATNAPTRNLLGPVGAIFSDLTMRLFGLAGVFIILPPTFWALQLITRRRLDGARVKLTLAASAVLLLACAASSLPSIATWPVPYGLGGFLGDQALRLPSGLLVTLGPGRANTAAGVACFACGVMLLLASLGLSPRDLKVMCQDRRRLSFQFIALGWRRLGTAFDRNSAAGPIRHEPTLAMPPFPFAADRLTTWRAEPSFDREAQLASGGSVPSSDDLNVPEAARDPEFDGLTDTECHAMARRFAPPREASSEASRFLLRHAARSDSVRKRAPESTAGGERVSCRISTSPGRASSIARSPAARKSKVEHKPIWPGSLPVPVGKDALPARHYARNRRAGDELYGRAVAIVRADRKASTEYLQQRLGIGYMRAADLIERMEQEGILGAPVRNGMRPILGRVPRSRVV